VAEFVPGYKATVWNGLVAPKNTPADIIDKLHKEIDAGLGDPKMMARFAQAGSVPKSMTIVDFGKFIVEDTEKWGPTSRRTDAVARSIFRNTRSAKMSALGTSRQFVATQHFGRFRARRIFD
jgi:Tripartite tricarboxylate transporter family receptor